MELPQQPGAGPELTGIAEQLTLFELREAPAACASETTPCDDATLQAQRVGPRPELTEHVITRGERLGGLCLRPRGRRQP